MNRAIAEQLNIDEKKIAVWKQRDKWNVAQQKKQPVKKARSPSKKAKEEVEEELVESGRSINRTAREIQKQAGEGYYNAVRLARTEMTRAAAQGANHSYMQNADIMDGKR